DLYAVGLVMAEAMTGQVVFQGSNGIKVCMDQASDMPVPLSPAVLASPLGPAIHRATQKHPAHRYHSAEEMAFEVERAMQRASSLLPAMPLPITGVAGASLHPTMPSTPATLPMSAGGEAPGRKPWALI